jgi:hypothetical protein
MTICPAVWFSHRTDSVTPYKTCSKFTDTDTAHGLWQWQPGSYKGNAKKKTIQHQAHCLLPGHEAIFPGDVRVYEFR